MHAAVSGRIVASLHHERLPALLVEEMGNLAPPRQHQRGVRCPDA